MNLDSLHDSVCGFVREHKGHFIAGGLIIIAYKGYVMHREHQKRTKWDSAGKDVVVLHGVRARTIPSASPFILKVEMFLKMAGIKYVFDTSQVMGPKTKTPWITLNGEDCADSELIFDFLKQKFPNTDFNAHLTTEQKAIARAFQIMTDEHIFWGLALQRFYFDGGKQMMKCWTVPWSLVLLVAFIGRALHKRSKNQGIGLHSQFEIESMIGKDIKAISLYLGDKKFMMGDRLSEVDCSVFGFMSQFIWVDTTSPYARMIREDLDNIEKYCHRVRAAVWSDWQQLCVG